MYGRMLTIQDVSCVGQCSATVALPVISACGIECAMLPSAVLSNHTGGFSAWTFRDLTDEMPKIEAEWQRQNIKFDAFYTGYVCPPQIDPILSIMKSAANPDALRFVDPVMADNGKLYTGFGDDFPAQMARLCEGADYILPNLTEAAFLLGRKPVLEGYDKAFIEEMAAALHALGAKNVVLTGVSFEPGLAKREGEGHRFSDEVASTLRADMGDNRPAVATVDYIVRRLTPLECERLQGLPDGYTKIPYRGKPPDECPDTPRYKALGNGWAVNCARWIAQRIQEHDKETRNGNE